MKDRRLKPIEDAAVMAYAESLRDKELLDLVSNTVMRLQNIADKLEEISSSREGIGDA